HGLNGRYGVTAGLGKATPIRQRSAAFICSGLGGPPFRPTANALWVLRAAWHRLAARGLSQALAGLGRLLAYASRDLVSVIQRLARIVRDMRDHPRRILSGTKAPLREVAKRIEGLGGLLA